MCIIIPYNGFGNFNISTKDELHNVFIAFSLYREAN